MKERQLLLKASFKALGIKDYPIEIDWEKLGDEIFNNDRDIQPILWHGIKKGVLPLPPDKFANMLKESQLVLRANSIIQNALIDEMLLKALSRGVRICLLKGAALSRVYYPDVTLRSMCDIDILVKDRCKNAIREILKEMGAAFIDSNWAHERYIFPKSNNVLVEVHSHLINIELIFQRFFFPKDYLENIPWDEMIEMEGGGMQLPASFEYDYLHLHAFKEGYSSLKWFIDIALIDKKLNENENIIDIKFMKNIRNMTLDIISLLVCEERDINQKKNFFWKHAIRFGARGTFRKKEKLLMAMACAIT